MKLYDKEGFLWLSDDFFELFGVGAALFFWIIFSPILLPGLLFRKTKANTRGHKR